MKRGFTLVELSIVLVIIGLLIGGILVAQSMISTAKIQMLARDIHQYQAAIANFHTNYGKWPGDSRYFDPPGNNDGVLDSNKNTTTEPCVGNYSPNEGLQVWAHLSQSKMLDKVFTPFEPSVCSGSGYYQDYFPTIYYDAAGISGPAIDVDERAALVFWAPGKYNILVSNNGSRLYFGMFMNVKEGMALQNKVNGQLMCSYDSYAANGVACNDPLAEVANLTVPLVM